MEKNVFVVVGRGDKSREYRKGNWTLDETMVLIQAKKMDCERREQRLKELPRGSSGRPQEMRWKWVEDRCWGRGCYRSQNQCNDRWDNLMRDYNKVRAYETSPSVGGNPDLSYWNLEKNDRKERNLPSNVLPEVYEALTEVVQRKRSGAASGPPGRPMEEKRRRGPGAGSPAPLHARPVTTTDSEDSEHPISPQRKRKRGEGSSSNTLELSSAIMKCASIMGEALQAGEKQEEVRHKDLISIERRKAKLEESKSVMGMQSMDGLAAAINMLASSILGLVTGRVQKLQNK
ncbi:trihelix transcription factor ASR3-like [Musa acuminata AAA Group]|uniref:trihelix transcription factor ASR3-like n=1 Tax=Musa acuminata AAA Group TaxID=214697 RepID=UPI0031DD3FF7